MEKKNNELFGQHNIYEIYCIYVYMHTYAHMTFAGKCIQKTKWK